MITLSDIKPDWNDYLEEMSKDGEWADALFLVATAHMLKRDILVVTSSPQGIGDADCHWIVGDIDFSGIPIRLGHVWELHYRSLGEYEHVLKKPMQRNTFVHTCRHS